jgi:hypothetical protein
LRDASELTEREDDLFVGRLPSRGLERSEGRENSDASDREDDAFWEEILVELRERYWPALLLLPFSSNEVDE